MDEVRRVAGCLRSRWHVIAPDDWTEACIQWVRDENQASRLSADALNNMVYEQWLLSDLRELGSQCLPQVALQQETFTLTGQYCLQMESVVDVSVSFYSQLQKVRGAENTNVQVSASTQYTQKDAKASRMLMMKLTDGSVDIQGMEYQPVPSLSVDTTPGTKLLIRGSVLCRLGVLMLKRENVSVLGGEVESLTESNSKERLLARMLGQNEELVQRPPQPQRTEYNARPLVNNARPAVNNARPHAVNNACHQRQAAISIQNGTRENDVSVQSDDFPEDDFLDNLDAAQLAAMEQEDWDDDIDFESAMPVQHPADRQSSLTLPDAGYGHSQMEHSDMGPPRNVNNLTVASDRSISLPGLNHTSNNSDNTRTISHVAGISRSQSITNPQQNRLHNQYRALSTPVARPSHSVRPVASGSSRNSSATHQQSLVGCSGNSIDLTDEFDMDDDSVFYPVHAAKRQKIAAVVPPMRKALGLDSEPFTYLNKVKQSLPAAQQITFKVKAYIGTLISKLEHGDGTAWSLRVKLNDGTATVDCDLSNEMLSSLIGFTAAESVQMREAARRDKNVRKQLSEGIKSCQRSLIQMNSILRVSVSPHRPLPCICAEVKFTAEHCVSLESRVRSALNLPL